MAVNGRCFSFLEEGLTEGRPGLDISIYTTDSRVVISFEIHFAMQIYQTLGLACRRISDIRTLCHKFPGHLNDPVIKGFKHRQRDEFLTMEIRVADEIFESDLMRQLRKGDQMVNLITNLRQFFADFQPVNDRTQLQGRCRRRTFYDVNRLAGTAAQYGRDWGFSADNIVQQYQAMASKPVLGLKTPKFSAREALDSDEIDSKPQHYTFAESEGSFLVFPEEDLFTPPSQQPPAPGALLSFTGFDQLSLEAHREFEPEIMWAPQYCLDDSNSVDRLEFQPSTPFDNAGFGELTFDDEFCLSSWLA